MVVLGHIIEGVVQYSRHGLVAETHNDRTEFDGKNTNKKDPRL